jgi:hypothetical protein
MEFCGDEVSGSRSSGFYKFPANVLSDESFLVLTGLVDNFVD